MEINKQKILEKSLQIRYFEERLLEEYKKGSIHGTVHTCIGQEIFPCILAEFTKEYFWFSNHRGHGHYIAKTGDFKGLAAEILLKKLQLQLELGSQHLKILTLFQMVYKVAKRVWRQGIVHNFLIKMKNTLQ